jgi:serine/threonine-protein kinase
VGIILYEMLTAKQPFPADNEFARLTAVLTEEVVPIEQAAPQLAAWSGFFKRALAKEPAQRFQSADEMAQALSAMAHSGVYQPPGPPQATPPTMAPNRGGQHGTVPSMQAYQAAPTPAPPPPQQQQPQYAQPPQYTQQPYEQVSGHNRTIASIPPPPPAAMQPMNAPSAPMGMPGTASPTYMSAHKPDGGQAYAPPGAPVVEIIQSPPRATVVNGAAWWIVGVVAVVAFGLGLSLGLLVH